MPAATSTTNLPFATAQALRSATATTVCLVLAEWWQLPHGNLAVWTTHLVTAKFTDTSFQKGFERVVGRGAGILAGLIVTTWLEGSHLLGLAVIAAFLMPCFYVYFSGRLAYTMLNAGLYAVALLEIGNADPASAVNQGKEMFLAVLLGVVVADGVNWVTGSERDLSIEVGGSPLLPLRLDWLNHSLMLVVTAALTLFCTHLLELPAEASAISVLMLTVTPHIQALLLKGELRIAGAVLATAWALGMFLVLALLPHFALLAGMLFLGQFVAAYGAQAWGAYSYAGLQMGLVLPMLVVTPSSEFGSLTPAAQRLEGILAALTASLLVGGLWPRFPFGEEPPPPAPAPGGGSEVIQPGNESVPGPR